MKTLLAAMRYFHYVVGITAPTKERERLVLVIWIGIFVALVMIGVLFTIFIAPRVLRE